MRQKKMIKKVPEWIGLLLLWRRLFREIYSQKINPIFINSRFNDLFPLAEKKDEVARYVKDENYLSVGNSLFMTRIFLYQVPEQPVFDLHEFFRTVASFARQHFR